MHLRLDQIQLQRAPGWDGRTVVVLPGPTVGALEQNLVIVLDDLPPGQTLEQYVDKSIEAIVATQGELRNCSRKTREIGGRPAIDVEFLPVLDPGNLNPKYKQIYVCHGQQALSITLVLKHPLSAELEAAVEGMLRSLTFLS